MTSISLYGLESSVTFDENDVNTAPRILDADVSFFDIGDDLDGGSLIVSGLVSEDFVQIRNQGTGAGQIGVSGTDVTYGGVLMGTLAGGVGDTLTVSFNGSATSAAVEALIENLTYSNPSNTPQTSRTLLIEVVNQYDDRGQAAIAVNVTPQNDAPALSNFASSVTFNENTVNAGSVFLDTTVDFTDAEGNLNGGTLTVSGLLAEDTVSLGNIGVAGSDVIFEGMIIGTVTGGVGSTLTVTFNDQATTELVQTVIQNLSYSNTSNTPTASRELILNVTDASGASLPGGTSPVQFEQQNGINNPFDGIGGLIIASPAFLDLDNDGDLDLLVGTNGGRYVDDGDNGYYVDKIRYFQNTGSGYVELSYGDNPLPASAGDDAQSLNPETVDLDGDGDLDLVVGHTYSELKVFRNDAGALVQLTGGDNPFDGIGLGSARTPAFGDLDGDGDKDLVIGDYDGTLKAFANTAGVFSELTGATNPFNGVDLGNYSHPAFIDIDGDGDDDLVAGNSAGQLAAFSNNAGVFTQLYGGDNPFTGVNVGNNAALTFADVDGDGDLDAAVGNFNGGVAYFENTAPLPPQGQTITVNVTAENDAPSLSNVATSVTFDEIDVNAAPAFLDTEVDVLDPEGNFDGGTLTVSGLLAEDTISLGSMAGPDSDVLFESVVIGTATGGAGSTLTVTFNAQATNQAVQALIQNLSYSNSSDTPTASRELVLTVTDSFGATSPGVFVHRTGSENPFADLTTLEHAAPSFIDLDGDGDLDIIAGSQTGRADPNDGSVRIDRLQYFENTESGYVERSGSENPAPAIIDLEPFSYDNRRAKPATGDFDGDGDLDLVVGAEQGLLRSFRNDNGVFVELTGNLNPFNGADVGRYSAPAFGDVDGDGDLDLVVGNYAAQLTTFRNDSGVFVKLVGAQNPFDGVDLNYYGNPTFFDLEADGDPDLVVGTYNGQVSSFRNDNGVFTQLLGVDNPFSGFAMAYASPASVDVDGDGDLDLLFGQSNGAIEYYENTAPLPPQIQPRTITVNVTPQNDAPVEAANDGLTLDEGASATITGSMLDFDDPEQFDSQITYTVTSLAAHGEVRLNGTALAVNDTFTQAYIGTSIVTYVHDGSETTTDSFGFSVSDGVGAPVTDQSFAITVTPVNDFPAEAANTGISVAEGASIAILGDALDFNDPEQVDTAITYTVTSVAAHGELRLNGVGFGVNGTFTQADLVAGLVTYAHDGSETTSDSFDFSVSDGVGATVIGQTFGIDVTPVNDAPTLSGFDASVTFAENTVNATPQYLDINVTVSDAEDNFDGGTLALSGLLSEDRVAIASQGDLFGQINTDGSDVTYGGLIIGTWAGGEGADLTVTFNGAATSAAIKVLIQNLTYANTSDTPTASRDFVLNITDADGSDLSSGPVSPAVFEQQTGADNPFGAIGNLVLSAPAFIDLDDDGDLDVLIGTGIGRPKPGEPGMYIDNIRYLENTGSGYVEQSGASNPLSAAVGSFDYNTKPFAFDLDDDGDLDLVYGTDRGVLKAARNDDGVLVALTGSANPFNAIDIGDNSSPAFGDIDGDGDMDLVVGRSVSGLRTFQNQAGAFTELTGGANPLGGLTNGAYSHPALVDLDGDGDADLVVGNAAGTLSAFSNQGGVFTVMTGAENPFNGVDLGDYATPGFADIDGDGDLDAVAGAVDGSLQYFQNIAPVATVGQTITVNVTAENDVPAATGIPADLTVVEDTASNLDLSAITLTDVDTLGDISVILTASAGTLTAVSSGDVIVSGSASDELTLTGTASDIDAYLNSTANIKYTGAANAYGNNAATVTLSANDGPGSVLLGTVNIDITGENDAPTVTDLPPDVTATEDTYLSLDLSAMTLSDADANDTVTLSLTASAGILKATNGGGVAVTGTGTSALTLTGTAADIDAFLNTASNILYLGAVNASGDNAATLTLSANDGSDAVMLGTVNIDIVGVNDRPVLTGFAASAAFGENTIQATPGLIDSSVVFTDVEGNFDGGALTVTGLLTEDIVSVRNQGAATGQIGLSGTTVSYAGAAIGTLSGGAGAALTITLNASATSEAVDALIENLTYTTTSNTPTAIRTLTLNVTDAAGGQLTPPSLMGFAAQSGDDNPFNGLSLGQYAAVAVGDIDHDGDIDVVVGLKTGAFVYLENTGSAMAPAFTQRSGVDNPLAAFAGNEYASPSLVDLDGDGDLDVVSGEPSGQIRYLENTGSASVAAFEERTGASNPFDGIDIDGFANPKFADIDGDGDQDLIVSIGGLVPYFENTGSATSPVFVERTGAANPFLNVPFDAYAQTAFADLDGDGDLDIISGHADGDFRFTENTGTATAPVFVLRSRADGLPLNAVDLGSYTTTAFADLNNDGVLDFIASNVDGEIAYFVGANNPAVPITVTINVTAQNDKPVATGIPSDVIVIEDTASNLDLSAITLTDVDTLGSITVTLTVPVGAGTMTAANGGSVTVSGSGTRTLTLAGTAINIDAYLNTATAIKYTGANNANGDNATILTISTNDGTGAVSLGTVNIDITAVNDAPTLTGIATSVTFAENTVNAGPQVIDSDVVFGDAEANLTGGQLTVSRLLAQDTVSVRNEGADTGQIGVSGTDVTYGGVVFGTLSGGVGATLTVTFSAAATVAAVDALIQNLTYANSSDTPIATRTLLLNVSDATGTGLPVQSAYFAVTSGSSSPFASLDVGRLAKPEFVDLDGDGDLDIVVGNQNGTFSYLKNTGNTSEPVYTNVTGAENPLNGKDIGSYSAPSFVDMDGDGDLDLVSGSNDGPIAYLENTGSSSAPAFTARTGSANPFAYNAATIGFKTATTFADLDNDGDQDALIFGAGKVSYARNDGTSSTPSFTLVTDGGNPFSAIPTSDGYSPHLFDVDGDGDKDLFFGKLDGTFGYYGNTGTSSAPVFTARTGSANPLNGIDVGGIASGSFADIDNDGDLDLVTGESEGAVIYYRNDTGPGANIVVNVTAQNDAPTAVASSGSVNYVENATRLVIDSGITIADVDSANMTSATVSITGGFRAGDELNFTSEDGGTGQISGSYNATTGVLTLTTTSGASLAAFQQALRMVTFASSSDTPGTATRTISFVVNDGSASSSAVTHDVTVTEVNDAPEAYWFGGPKVFYENTVNATPQVISPNVGISDAEGNFGGGSLTLSGLLAEDIVSVRNQGTGASQIGVDDNIITYAGMEIGTLSGGDGTTLTVTFTEAATTAAVSALINNLTYANNSDTPTASRTLSLNVMDSDGLDLTSPIAPDFQIGSSSSLAPAGTFHKPEFADLDGDGDLDLVIGAASGSLLYYQNTGSEASPSFTARTGADNPFNGMSFSSGAPALVDLDDDGDLDAVVGGSSGGLTYLKNTGTSEAPVFTAQFDANDPFDSLPNFAHSVPEFTDIDNDGDQDLIMGTEGGELVVMTNTGTASAPSFIYGDQLFEGVAVGNYSAPALADFDGDGDLDIVVGNISGGSPVYFKNTGTASAPVFEKQTGPANPFSAVSPSFALAPGVIDIDGDGDLDVLFGQGSGEFLVAYNANGPRTAAPVVINVTAENDIMVESANTGLTLNEGASISITSANLDFDDLDVADSAITYIVTALADHGEVRLNGVALELNGTFTQADLNEGLVSYAHDGGESTSDAFGFSVIGSEEDQLAGRTFVLTVTPVNDAPELTGVESSVTFGENLVNATPQLLAPDAQFLDAENNFDGGTLTVSGLLAEDIVSIGSDGMIGLSGSNVTNDGVIIGTVSGGTGSTLTVTFNGIGTTAMMQAVIQNLTYANTSDAPTSSRDLTINITDDSGADLGAAGPITFIARTGEANPVSGVGSSFYGTPTFIDLDDDGDLDAVVGANNGTLSSFLNQGAGLGFVAMDGAANPFDGLDVGSNSAPRAFDLDNDGDLDMIVGIGAGTFRVFDNNDGDTGFTELTGGDSPLNGIEPGFSPAAAFADIDDDGDIDVVSGNFFGEIKTYRNDGNAGFTQLTGTDNPFNGIDVGFNSSVTFNDLDGDGDADLVVGTGSGALRVFDRDDIGAGFTELTGTDNPFNGIVVGTAMSTPAFADLDGDGDLDLFAGSYSGQVYTYENTTVRGQTITVNVTPENDPGTANADAVVTTETTVLNGSVFADNGSGVDIEPDHPLAVAKVNGASIDVGHQITLASGALLTLNADGTFSYDPNGQFLHLAATGSGATNISATDSFTYELSGGETATVTVAINGVDNDDVLLGTSGLDTLRGGVGNDIYYATTGDTIVELADAGIDTVMMAAHATLAGVSHVENLTLTGTANYSATGNDADNVLTGNIGNNRFRGGAGHDTLVGGLGNDTYIDPTGDTIVELADEGVDTVETSVSFSLGGIANVENILITGAANVDATGNELANVLTGNTGHNRLSGGAGNDTLIGGAGNDTYVDVEGDTIVEQAGGGTDTVESSTSASLSGIAHVENLTLSGSGNIDGSGNELANVVTGNGGNNRLSGVAGADTLIGGLGNDVYVVDGLDTIIEIADGGTDTIEAELTYSLAALAYVENLTLTGTGDYSATGNEAANVLTGNSGNNRLSGGAGHDTLIGGLGNDTYIDPTGDTIVEQADEGVDTVETSVSFSLGGIANVENILITGDANVDATGNELANALTGNAGDNRLSGGTGHDTLTGGLGNDTYIDIDGDTIVELAGGGTDTVESSTSASLSGIAHVENLTLSGSGNIDGSGNELANVVTGNSGNNRLSGAAGADTLIGGLGNDVFAVDSLDTIVETAGGGTDTIEAEQNYSLAALAYVENLTFLGTGNFNATGNAAANILTGNSGDNRLRGGAGNDTLIGGLGNDTYIDPTGDTIIEQANGGADTIESSASFSLSGINHVENLTLTGTVSTNATGNNADNVLTGNSASNRLRGGAGLDTLIGGSGNDTYIDVEGDTIVELSGGGTDTVESSTSASLAGIAHVENMTLTGSGNIDATGNDLANVITGNSGNNRLTGGAGADTLIGGAGNDTYVDPTGDTMVEMSGGGTDTVESSVTFSISGISHIENLILTGGANIAGTGNYGNNVIQGNAGANALRGNLGADTMDGGAGVDTFVYRGVAESTGAGRDVIQNMDLRNEKFDFGTDKPVSIAASVLAGALNEASFDADLAAAIGAGELGAHQAVLFAANSGTPELMSQRFLIVDVNGIAGYQAGADYVVQLSNHTGTLTIDDFI